MLFSQQNYVYFLQSRFVTVYSFIENGLGSEFQEFFALTQRQKMFSTMHNSRYFIFLKV